MNLFSLDKNNILNILAVFIVGFFAVSAYVTKPSFLTIPTAESSTAENVTGYAWSEHIGWISFNGAETGSPPAPPIFAGGTIAQVQWGGTNAGKVSGWAR